MKENYYLHEPWLRCGVFAGFTKRTVTGADIPREMGLLLKEQGISVFRLSHLKQVHGKEIFLAGEVSGALGEGDGLITTLPDHWLIIKTADCVPVFILDPGKGVLSLLHSGWKSARAGIIGDALKKLSLKGVRINDLEILIGPCLRQECFEVKEDFLIHEPFLAFIKKGDGKMLFDLPGYVKEELIQSGVSPEKIADPGFCSVCQNDQFYSFRKEKQTTFRTLSFIGRALKRECQNP